MTKTVCNLNTDSVWCEECDSGPLQMWATLRGDSLVETWQIADSTCENEDIIICLDCYDEFPKDV